MLVKTPCHLRRDPILATGEECPRPRLGYATRHNQLDGAVQPYPDRDATRARAETQAGLELAAAGFPQPQLRRYCRVVGYSHSMMIAATPAELIDIGVNLTHESFEQDLPDILQRALNAGVRRMIVTGTSVAATHSALNLHREHPTRLFATAGLHPHHASDLTDGVLSELHALCCDPGVRAIGECGLDFYRNYSPREAQIRAFRAQLELAVRLRKPVFLHQRDAHADFLSIVREFRSELVGGVAHCFTGQGNELLDYLALDLHIGVTGWICDERRGKHLLPLMPQIPAERLMLETDSPYLLPRSLIPRPSTRRNEPALLAEVARVVAGARSEDYAVLARTTTETAARFFELPAE